MAGAITVPPQTWLWHPHTQVRTISSKKETLHFCSQIEQHPVQSKAMSSFDDVNQLYKQTPGIITIYSGDASSYAEVIEKAERKGKQEAATALSFSKIACYSVHVADVDCGSKAQVR